MATNIYNKKMRFTETLVFRKSRPIIDSLSNILGVSITLFDRNGNLTYQSSWRHQYCETIKADPSCSDHYAKIIDYVRNYQMPYIQECHAGFVTVAYPLIIQDNTQEIFSEVLIGILFFSPLLLHEQNKDLGEHLAPTAKESDNSQYRQPKELVKGVRTFSRYELNQIEGLIYTIFGEIIDSSQEISKIVEHSVAFQNELTLLYDFVKKAGGKTNLIDMLLYIQSILDTNIRPSQLLVLLNDEYIKELAALDNLAEKTENIRVNSISKVSDKGFLAEAIENGRTSIKNNMEGDSIFQFIIDLIAQKGMACPIKFDNKLIGLMVFFDKKDGEDFFADDAKFAEALAASIGVVLEIIYLTTKLAKSETWKEISFRAAHKIGNALFALKGPIAQIKLLQNTGKLTDDKVAELANRLDERMKEADYIIRAIKDYIRPGELNLKQTNINSILRKVIQDMRITISEKISLKTQFADGLPLVPLDIEKISRAIEELIQNATFFVGENGEINIRTYIASSDEKRELAFSLDEEFIVIDISDNGAGILDKNKERIFYPFFSTRAAGTGQGLAIVSTDIQLHSGGIKEVGKYGEGARFLILLPLDKNRGKSNETNINC
jgi:nitrogen-specific signal transduction histidine kinase